MYSSTRPDPADEGPPTAPEEGTATDRLYHTDSYCREFTARVRAVGARPGRGGVAVVLDRTAFYPTSGGQPHDTGMLAGARVVEVLEEGSAIVHLVEEGQAGAALRVGAEVRGVLDWDRRYDHMQQHTAQHILSAAFLQVMGAETLSVHLGATCTLDLNVASLDPEGVRRVEDAACQVVFANRSVTVRFVDTGDLAGLALRRPPRRAGPLRLVEVDGYDRSACGGTHVRATGEVGAILVRRWERVRGGTRVEFLAGWRAVRDYRRKHDLVSRWSRRLGVGDQELDDALGRLADEAGSRSRALQDLRKRLVVYEACERLASAPTVGELKLVRLEAPRRDAEEVRLLLRELTARERCVVVAGVVEDGRVYCARTAGGGPDVAALLSRACAAAGGRGGGTAEFAQGAVPPGDAVRAVLRQVEAEVSGAGAP